LYPTARTVFFRFSEALQGRQNDEHPKSLYPLLFDNFDGLVKRSQALLASNLARDSQADGDSFKAGGNAIGFYYLLSTCLKNA
jgi:hypothetical protein